MNEKSAYYKARRSFRESRTLEKRLKRLRDVCHNGTRFAYARTVLESVLVPGQDDDFISFEEYTRHRESNSHELGWCYQDLLTVPTQEGTTAHMQLPIDLLPTEWPVVDESQKLQVRWISQMYEEELKELWGGFKLIDARYLPLGVVTMMRRKAVQWTMVL